MFHIPQLRYVVIELKIGAFRPEYAGQLGFYVTLVDERLRGPQHHATVGILLCADRKESTVRYALQSTTAPMAVATYTYADLPPAERATMPAERIVTQALTDVLTHTTDPS